MNVSDLRRLYAFTDWANERIVAAIEALSEEQISRPIMSSYPSIRETFSHIAFAEWLWLERFKGVTRSETPEWTKSESFATLRDEWRRVAENRRSYLAKLKEEALEPAIHYVSLKGDPFDMPLGQVMIHCANHSTHHRGQLVMMLRQVGATPPNTDYTTYLRSQDVTAVSR